MQELYKNAVSLDAQLTSCNLMNCPSNMKISQLGPWPKLFKAWAVQQQVNKYYKNLLGFSIDGANHPLNIWGLDFVWVIPWGDFLMEQTGMLVRNFEFNP